MKSNFSISPLLQRLMIFGYLWCLCVSKLELFGKKIIIKKWNKSKKRREKKVVKKINFDFCWDEFVSFVFEKILSSQRSLKNSKFLRCVFKNFQAKISSLLVLKKVVKIFQNLTSLIFKVRSKLWHEFWSVNWGVLRSQLKNLPTVMKDSNEKKCGMHFSALIYTQKKFFSAGDFCLFSISFAFFPLFRPKRNINLTKNL